MTAWSEGAVGLFCFGLFFTAAWILPLIAVVEYRHWRERRSTPDNTDSQVTP